MPPDKHATPLEQLKYALDQHAIVSITDVHGRIISANDKFCNISQYSREELLGQDHRIFNSGYHTKEFFADMWTALSHGQVWQGEVRNSNKAGGLYWVDTTIVPVMDDKGKPCQYIAIRTDITEQRLLTETLRESETKYRKLFEHTKGGVFLLDLTGCVYINQHGLRQVDLTVLAPRHYIDCNEEAANMYGLTREEMLSCHSGCSQPTVPASVSVLMAVCQAMI